MSAARRALAVLPLLAVALAAPSARAASVQTLPCVNYIQDRGAPSGAMATMPVVASGFTPGRPVTLWTSSARARPLPVISGLADASGVLKGLAAPPALASPATNLESFSLIAADPTNPSLTAGPFAFSVVRFGMTRSPAPQRPDQRVKFSARGYVPGKRVYAHFRHRGRTRRTVTLGVAKGPCGITSRRMRALPTKLRYGTWRVYVDQSERFSSRSRPQWIDPFQVTRGR
ncbi:MAG TPA: hypothetical protein VNT54_12470 [Solirubrobacteraceae bacterium]|nr:hypothetical protein [Solirubrobacteraceae bacterium]